MKEDRYELQQNLEHNGERYYQGVVKTKIEWEELLEVDMEFFSRDWFKKVEDQEECILNSTEFETILKVYRIIPATNIDHIKSFIRKNKDRIK